MIEAAISLGFGSVGLGPGGISKGGSCVFEPSLGIGAFNRIAKENKDTAIKAIALDLATAESESSGDPIGISTFRIEKVRYRDKINGEIKEEKTLVSPEFNNEPIQVWTDAGENGLGTPDEWKRIDERARKLANTNSDAIMFWVSPSSVESSDLTPHRAYLWVKKDDQVTGYSYSLGGERETLVKMMKKLGNQEVVNRPVEEQTILSQGNNLTHGDVFNAFTSSLETAEQAHLKPFLDRFQQEVAVPDSVREERLKQAEQVFETKLREAYHDDIKSAFQAAVFGFTRISQVVDSLEKMQNKPILASPKQDLAVSEVRVVEGKRYSERLGEMPLAGVNRSATGINPRESLAKVEARPSASEPVIKKDVGEGVEVSHNLFTQENTVKRIIVKLLQPQDGKIPTPKTDGNGRGGELSPVDRQLASKIIEPVVGGLLGLFFIITKLKDDNLTQDDIVSAQLVRSAEAQLGKEGDYLKKIEQPALDERKLEMKQIGKTDGYQIPTNILTIWQELMVSQGKKNGTGWSACQKDPIKIEKESRESVTTSAALPIQRALDVLVGWGGRRVDDSFNTRSTVMEPPGAEIWEKEVIDLGRRVLEVLFEEKEMVQAKDLELASFPEALFVLTLLLTAYSQDATSKEEKLFLTALVYWEIKQVVSKKIPLDEPSVSVTVSQQIIKLSQPLKPLEDRFEELIWRVNKKFKEDLDKEQVVESDREEISPHILLILCYLAGKVESGKEVKIPEDSCQTNQSKMMKAHNQQKKLPQFYTLERLLGAGYLRIKGIFGKRRKYKKLKSLLPRQAVIFYSWQYLLQRLSLVSQIPNSGVIYSYQFWFKA